MALHKRQNLLYGLEKIIQDQKSDKEMIQLAKKELNELLLAEGIKNYSEIVGKTK